MEENCLFKIKTKMEQQDYRKFLYIATLKNNVFAMPLMLLITGLAGYMIVITDYRFSILRFFIYWSLMIFVMIGVIYFKIESTIKKRLKTDKIGTINGVCIYEFYDEFIIAENEAIEGRNKIKYQQIYKIKETKDYFFIYINSTSAFLIRKKDMDNISRFKEFLKGIDGLKFKGK